MLCVCGCVVLAVVQQGLRIQCSSCDEESSVAPLVSRSSANTSLLRPFLQLPQFLPSPHLAPLHLLSTPAFSTSLTPALPVPCQCDPCVVLQQRLAEAAERGNIYRSVRWVELCSNCTHTVPRQSLQQQGHCCTRKGILSTRMFIQYLTCKHTF